MNLKTAFAIGTICKYKGNVYLVVGQRGDLRLINQPHVNNVKLQVRVSNLQYVGYVRSVLYKGASYLVTPKGYIVSVKTGNVMKWSDASKERREILELAQEPIEYL